MNPFRRLTPTRYIPNDSIEHNHPQGLGVVYSYSFGPGRIAAIAYGGKRNKADWHYTFKTPESLEAAVAKFFAGLDRHVEFVAERRKSHNTGHDFKVGDVVVNSWGYDQTNVDWYRVTRATKCFVWLKPIAGHVEETGFMSGKSQPHVDTTSADPQAWGFADVKNGEETQHKASGSHVNFEHGSGSKWDGREMHASWYA